MQNFGHSDLTLIIGLSIRFINSDESLKIISSLNKDLNEILQEEILKQSLMRSDSKYIESKRINLWVKILKIDKVLISEEYQKFYWLYKKELN